MTIYGPAAANPNRGNPQSMGRNEHEKFHRQAEINWGLDTKAASAAKNGVQLMVKSHLSGEVMPSGEFIEQITNYGKTPVANIIEISPITHHANPDTTVQLAARA